MKAATRKNISSSFTSEELDSDDLPKESSDSMGSESLDSNKMGTVDIEIVKVSDEEKKKTKNKEASPLI